MVTEERPDLDEGVLDSDGARRLYDRIAARYDLATAPFRLLRGRWPNWLADAGSRAMRFFGVNDSYRSHRPWEAIERHTTNVTYTDSHAGVIYLAAGTTPVP